MSTIMGTVATAACYHPPESVIAKDEGGHLACGVCKAVSTDNGETWISADLDKDATIGALFNVVRSMKALLVAISLRMEQQRAEMLPAHYTWWSIEKRHQEQEAEKARLRTVAESRLEQVRRAHAANEREIAELESLLRK